MLNSQDLRAIYKESEAGECKFALTNPLLRT